MGLGYMVYTIFLLAYVKLMAVIIEPYLDRKQELRYKLCFYGSIMVAASIPIYLGDPVNIFWTFPFYLAGIVLSSKGSRISRISVAIIFYPVFMIFNVITDDFNLIWLFENNLSRQGFLIMKCTVKIMLAGLLYLLGNKIKLSKKETAERELPNHMWYLIDLIASTPLAVVAFYIALMDTENDARAEVLHNAAPFLLMMPFLILCSIGILMLVRPLWYQQELEEQEIFWNMQHAYYKQVEEEHQRIRRLRHDMANHLHVLAVMKKEEQQDYIQDIMKTPAMAIKTHYCQNYIINTVIALKAYQMEEERISFDSQLIYPENLSIDRVELCSLFGNVLDNAIEACRKILDAKLRYIKLKGRAEKNLFMLQVTNSISGVSVCVKREAQENNKRKKREKETFLSTSKADKGLHGYGLPNIRQIAENHNGTMETRWTDETFTISVTMVLD